jgi:hypothetical protein
MSSHQIPKALERQRGPVSSPARARQVGAGDEIDRRHRIEIGAQVATLDSALDQGDHDGAARLSRLPANVARAFSSVPTPIFIYLGLLVLAVIAVALAVKREIDAGRRW